MPDGASIEVLKRVNDRKSNLRDLSGDGKKDDPSDGPAREMLVVVPVVRLGQLAITTRQNSLQRYARRLSRTMLALILERACR